MVAKLLNESFFVHEWVRIAKFDSCSRQVNKRAASKINRIRLVHWGSNKERDERLDGNSTTKVISVCS